MISLRWRQWLVPAAYLLLMGLIAVFAHSGLQGDHGLAAFREAGHTEQRLMAELETLRHERSVIENKVRRLGDNFLDLDLLDERARATLGLIGQDEIVVR